MRRIEQKVAPPAVIEAAALPFGLQVLERRRHSQNGLVVVEDGRALIGPVRVAILRVGEAATLRHALVDVCADGLLQIGVVEGKG